MSKTSSIRHPKEHPFVRIYRWQMEACEQNACAAALLSFFEVRHNWKIESSLKARQANDIAEKHGDRRTQDESLYQWHNEEELEAGIIALYGRVTIGKGIKFLEKMGFISVTKNPNSRYAFDRTRYFIFHPDVVQRWIDQHYPHTPGNSGTPPKSKIVGREFNFEGSSAKTEGRSLNLEAPSHNNGLSPLNFGASYTKETTKETSEETTSTTPRAKIFETVPGLNVVVDAFSISSNGEEGAIAPTLAGRLQKAGVSPKIAAKLAASDPNESRRQLEYLPDRGAENPGALLKNAIEGAWGPPVAYLKRQEAQELAEKRRAANEAAEAETARQKAAERAEISRQLDEAAHLDEMWGKLDSKTQERLETLAKERLGVLGQMGRAKGALDAMRRNVLREMLGKATEESENEAAHVA